MSLRRSRTSNISKACIKYSRNPSKGNRFTCIEGNVCRLQLQTQNMSRGGLISYRIKIQSLPENPVDLSPFHIVELKFCD